MDNFKDKGVVITGGATGIGFSLAKRFGENGAKIILAGLRKDRLEQAVTELTGLGFNATHFICDVSDPKAVTALADFAWDTLGEVNVIVNNAGMSLPPASIVDFPLENLRRIFDVNVFGVWHGSAIFGKRFITQGKNAAIYNIGSENSLFNAVPLASPYIATKHAVLAITESLREEMPEFIKVGLICPGFVKSEIGPAAIMAKGMDTDAFTHVIMKQIIAGEYYIVSHAYNAVRIEKRYDEMLEAYARNAPRYKGDIEFDMKSLLEKAKNNPLN